jgi:hypothetical protein
MPSGGNLTVSPGPRMKTALAVAILADLLQLVILPFVIEGAISPADDLIDIGVAGVLAALLGWHWEFLPSFAGKLVPGFDMVPLWTLAVANVYRKSKAMAASAAAERIQNEAQPRHG